MILVNLDDDDDDVVVVLMMVDLPATLVNM